MRIGVSIENKCISSVLINSSGMMINSFYNRFQDSSDFEISFYNNLHTLTQFNKASNHEIFICSNLFREITSDIQSLKKVGVLRLAGHKPDILMPGYHWPKSFREKVLADVQVVNGGYEFNGEEITPINEEEVLCAVKSLIILGAEKIVISGTFSVFFPNQEKYVEQMINKNFELETFCSHKIIIDGLVEREGSSILNLSAKDAYQSYLVAIKNGLNNLHIYTEPLFTQKNGSVLRMDEVRAVPIKTIDSGLFSTFFGACKLTSYESSVLVKVEPKKTIIAKVQNGRIMQNPYVESFDVNIDSSFDELDVGLISPNDMGDVTLKEAMFAYQNNEYSDGISYDQALSCIGHYHDDLALWRKKMCDSVNAPLVLITTPDQDVAQPKGRKVSPFLNFSAAYGAALHGIAISETLIIDIRNREKTLVHISENLICRVKKRGGHNPTVRYCFVQPYRYLDGDWAKVRLFVSGDAVFEKKETISFTHKRIEKSKERGNLYSGQEFHRHHTLPSI